MERKLKTKELLNNSYHLTIGMFWLIMLALAKIFRGKNKIPYKLREKILYRIDKMY